MAKPNTLPFSYQPRCSFRYLKERCFFPIYQHNIFPIHSCISQHFLVWTDVSTAPAEADSGSMPHTNILTAGFSPSVSQPPFSVCLLFFPPYLTATQLTALKCARDRTLKYGKLFDNRLANYCSHYTNILFCSPEILKTVQLQVEENISKA